MRENLMEIYSVLIKDEKLLRLLAYKPLNPNDNPLDVKKPNVLDKSMKELQKIIKDRVLYTQKTGDLTTEPICRVCVFPGNRDNTRNYIVASQDIMFDIYAHLEFDQVDLRMSWICDHINELICHERITGMGKINFVAGRPITTAPNNFVGYRLVFEFGSGKE